MKRDRAPSVQQITGRGPTIEAGGTLYRLTFNDQNAKGELEELIRAHVLRKADADANSLGGDAGERHYNRVQDRVDHGDYATFGRGWNSVLTSRDGTPLMLLSFLRQHHPLMTFDAARELLAAETRQCKAALRVICPDFFRSVLEQLASGAEAKKINRAELEAALASLVTAMNEQWGEPEEVAAEVAEETGPPMPGLMPEPATG